MTAGAKLPWQVASAVCVRGLQVAMASCDRCMCGIMAGCHRNLRSPYVRGLNVLLLGKWYYYVKAIDLKKACDGKRKIAEFKRGMRYGQTWSKSLKCEFHSSSQ